jgi:hypothetical protein
LASGSHQTVKSKTVLCPASDRHNLIVTVVFIEENIFFAQNKRYAKLVQESPIFALQGFVCHCAKRGKKNGPTGIRR